jgi:hypothetical protein
VIQVFLNDDNMSYDFAEQHFYNANLWARERCRSYKGHDVQDVSDVSYTNDFIALYLFEDEQDALMFRLKWA